MHPGRRRRYRRLDHLRIQRPRHLLNLLPLVCGHGQLDSGKEPRPMKEFPQIIGEVKKAMAAGLNVLLEGPIGVGKNSPCLLRSERPRLLCKVF